MKFGSLWARTKGLFKRSKQAAPLNSFSERNRKALDLLAKYDTEHPMEYGGDCEHCSRGHLYIQDGWRQCDWCGYEKEAL